MEIGRETGESGREGDRGRGRKNTYASREPDVILGVLLVQAFRGGLATLNAQAVAVPAVDRDCWSWRGRSRRRGRRGGG